ncbi:branched-chain amino acid ABC transporter substrate-binding protein [Pseudolabrys taiwanensis]|uniref:Branched-chain amino acid ABC transporter substrate-binding protein n=1 Tax=Pseudolabrys taiwanensis TaxID=331696 RepID=A0A345ZWG1_9HYPH|nr:amino acid ABC transporter substrate-binding protein [Pseudolabrys taiwanensis]AXK81258.1 branched-chain amino acid ABC transporter substrate-binding protein [Pseudolabrys taiwanensis]
MLDKLKTRILAWTAGTAVAVATTAMVTGGAVAQNKEPIKIGFSMALTGPLAANGKQTLLGMKIWEEQTNAKGGLIGRPVKLVYYDDQSNPSTVPGIYTKLLDVDKVDLVVSGYATNMIAPAMPVVMQKGKTFVTLFGLDVNAEFKYPKYFSVIPTGPRTKPSFTEGLFQVALQQDPKPTTVALVAEDAEFSKNACEGARTNAKDMNLKIVYDRSFPPGTTDFSPILRAVQASNADIVVVCSYPLSSVGIVLAVNEMNYKPKIIGGAMVGLQATVFKQKLGSKMNGFVNYETWVPSDKMMAPAAAFFKTYQAKAGAEGVDPLGYYLGGWGNAYVDALGQAIEGTKSLDDNKIAEYFRKSTFKTVMGEWSYGPGGEWTKSGMMQVQYHNVKDGNDLDQWRGMAVQTVLTPPELATGKVIYPYEKAK